MKRSRKMFMHREGTRRVVALSVLLGLLLAFVPAPPAGADSSYSAVKHVEIDNLGFSGATGFSCAVALHWENTGTLERVWIDGSCTNGYLDFDRTIQFAIDAGTCGTSTYTATEIEDAPDFSGIMLGAGTTGCGLVTEVCYVAEVVGAWDWVDVENQVIEGCESIDLGSPPDAVDETEATQAGTCPLGTLLRPYVTAWVTGGTTGAWYWQQTVTLRVAGQTTGTLAINSVAAHLHGYVSYDIGTTMTFPSYTPSTVDRDTTGLTAGVSFEETTGGAALLYPSVMLTARTVNKTGAVGSAAPPNLRAAGYYSSPSRGAGASTQFGQQSLPSPLLASTWSTASGGSYNNARNYAGHTKPSWCYATWGTPTQDGTGESVPVDALGDPGVDGSAPPTYEPPGEPPVVHIGPDCPPEATVCIDYSGPVSDPVLPNPDAAECDFSISDPETWGGQVICAMVRLFQILYAMVTTIVQLLVAMLNAITDLLVPPDGMWAEALAVITGAWEDSTLDEWSDTLGALVPDDPGEGSCQGPGVGPITLLDDAPGSSGAVDVPEMFPFDACGEKAAPAAMVKGVLTVGVTLGGAWRMWDMLAGAFGAYRGGGRHMSESEWL